jgi:Zn-dependent protease with chaperone function
MTPTAKTQHARIYTANHITFPDISYKAFVYPGDEEALAALKAIPGAGQVLTWIQENFTEELMFLQNNEQMMRASYHNYASLYKMVERCADILSLPVPELYITTNPTMNAYTMGQRRTSIVLHSELVECMTLDELSFVIGHELGHIKCAHGLYRSLGDLLIRYWELVVSMLPIPGLALLRVPLLLAYWEWFRRAELTCDRAGLLCVQDAASGMSGLAKLAGKVRGYEDEFNPDAALKQAGASKEVKNKLVVLVAILEAAQNTHPFVPSRLKQLDLFAQSDQYKKLLAGDYEKDLFGAHEGGARVTCACGLKVNAKLSFCPECGRAMADPEAAAAAAASDAGTKPAEESKLDKLKSLGGGLFKR